MSTENNNQEHDFSIPPIPKKTQKKRQIKKGWIIFAIVVLLVVIILYFSKPYIVEYIREQIKTIGHPDGPAFALD